MEDQRWADIRIPRLVQTPAAIRFLSCEPLLDRIDLRNYVNGGKSEGIDWVIVGESLAPIID